MLYTHLCSKCNTIAAILTALDWVRTDGLLGWWVGWFGVESLVFPLLYKFTGRFLFVSISQFNLFTFNTRTISERSLTLKKNSTKHPPQEMEVQEVWYAKSFVSSWFFLVEYSTSFDQNVGQQNRINDEWLLTEWLAFLSSNLIYLSEFIWYCRRI